MHKSRTHEITHVISRSSGNIASAESIFKDDGLTGKKHIAIKYTLAKAGVYRKLHHN